MTLLSHTVDRKGHRFRRIVYPLGWEGGGGEAQCASPWLRNSKKVSANFLFFIYLFIVTFTSHTLQQSHSISIIREMFSN